MPEGPAVAGKAIKGGLEEGEVWENGEAMQRTELVLHAKGLSLISVQCGYPKTTGIDSK